MNPSTPYHKFRNLFFYFDFFLYIYFVIKKQIIMTTMKQFLEQDGHLGFNLAIHRRFSSIGDSSYTEICGGFIEGVYQWATHNISHVEETSNEKWTGWTIHFESGATRRVYIPNWVMGITPTGWGHARNIFSKYLTEDHKYNVSEQARGHHWA